MLPMLKVRFSLSQGGISSLVDETHHRPQDDIVIGTSVLQQYSASIEPRHYDNERNSREQDTRHDEWNGGWWDGESHVCFVRDGSGMVVGSSLA